MVRWLKRFIAGHSRFSPCWLGCHLWSMPGGWCLKCGKCDKLFGGHGYCGKTCRHFDPNEWKEMQK